MTEQEQQQLTCGCTVVTSRDFLGRGVGRIVTRGDTCPRPDHAVGHTLLLPGRQHAGDR